MNFYFGLENTNFLKKKKLTVINNSFFQLFKNFNII